MKILYMRCFMSLRAMKLGCIREKIKKNFVFSAHLH